MEDKVYVESVDLFSVPKSKKEINYLIAFCGVKCSPKVSPMGQAYSEVSGDYSQVVCFLSEVLDMDIVEVMCSIGNERFWSYDKRGC